MIQDTLVPFHVTWHCCKASVLSVYMHTRIGAYVYIFTITRLHSVARQRACMQACVLFVTCLYSYIYCCICVHIYSHGTWLCFKAIFMHDWLCKCVRFLYAYTYMYIFSHTQSMVPLCACVPARKCVSYVYKYIQVCAYIRIFAHTQNMTPLQSNVREWLILCVLYWYVYTHLCKWLYVYINSRYDSTKS